jgi:predicted DCC family thiol-disulfide oxidoreductase YuxK
MRRLTVLYDHRCSFCRFCRGWLEKQPQLVDLEMVPATPRDVELLYPGLAVEAGEELVVIDDEGGVYRGDDAFLMCLWALREYREWSGRLSSGGWGNLARTFFHHLSKNRGRLSKVVDWWSGDDPAPCEDGKCQT